MEHEKINKFIVENMKNIFGFSLSRLQNREAADELARLYNPITNHDSVVNLPNQIPDRERGQ